MKSDKKTYYFVDGFSYLFRAYHALPPLTRKSDGLPVGALSGFCAMLFKLLQQVESREEQVYLAVMLDAGSSHRRALYSEYKANRPPAPEDLNVQIPLLEPAIKAFGITSIHKQGYEADDLIASYTKKAVAEKSDVVIVSSDKDLMQLVTSNVTMLDSMKNAVIDVAKVKEKFGVVPHKVLDVMALTGDSSDNIPGVPGIGVKTAMALIEEFGDLDTVLAQASTIKQRQRRDNLVKYASQARLSRQLVKLIDDIPTRPLEDLKYTHPSSSELIGFFKALEMNTLTRRLCAYFDMNGEAIEPLSAYAAVAPTQEDGTLDFKRADFKTADSKDDAQQQDMAQEKPAAYYEGYETIVTLQQLEAWIEDMPQAPCVAVDVETDSLDAMQGRLVGMSLCTQPGKACYIPFLHAPAEDLMTEEKREKQLASAQVLQRLKPLLEDESLMKIGQNIKYDALVLARHGVHLTPMDDTMLMSYVLGAGLGGHGMDALAQNLLNHEPITFEQVAGKGKGQITFDKVPLEKAARYAAEDADITYRLHTILNRKLLTEHQVEVYETLDRPLLLPIVHMEKNGIRVDAKVLHAISSDFATQMLALEDDIYQLAGERFNVGSPKQLGDILFEKHATPGGKKTKTGAWVTDAGTLETLRFQGHAIADKVLSWRELAKLKNTYTDALPNFINPTTGRVHTAYSLAATSTGRLASSHPNIQNIPIRSENGKKIRAAFIADEGHVLVRADYSQIELRLLACIADIPQLQAAFNEKKDIHALTASEVFAIPLEQVTPEQRRKAKAINFGIIYGISAFGLANQLHISRKEAAEYIDTYMQRFAGIRDYMESTVALCRQHGYVETLFGRRCYVRNINAKDAARRGFSQRAAINARIQGSAADVVRRAMAHILPHLEAHKARMLLQVHDELVFEVPRQNAPAMEELAKSVMEKAHLPACPLPVPLTVETSAAFNWNDSHE